MKLVLAALSALLLPACASTTPNYDARFGDAVREARQRMTIDPQAAAREQEVAGIDGKAAQEGTKRYQDSFKTPPPVTTVINIGGQIGSGK